MNFTIVIVALISAAVLGVLLFLRPDTTTAPITSAPRGQHRWHDDGSNCCKSQEQGSSTLWIGALEAAMALVMVLATLALADAANASRQASTASEQVVVDITPDTADQEPTTASAAGGASPVRPTHRLVALESSAADEGGTIIIELDSPLPVDRPVKFLINTNPNPK